MKKINYLQIKNIKAIKKKINVFQKIYYNLVQLFQNSL
jgi:hypothetical protein